MYPQFGQCQRSGSGPEVGTGYGTNAAPLTNV